jgi:hypothetical protein
MAGMDGLQNHRGGMRKFRFPCHVANYIYVADYLTIL